MRMTRGFGLAMLAVLSAVAITAVSFYGKIPTELKGIALSKPVPLDRADVYVDHGEAVFPVPGQQMDIFIVGYAHCPDICPFILENP